MDPYETLLSVFKRKLLLALILVALAGATSSLVYHNLMGTHWFAIVWFASDP